MKIAAICSAGGSAFFNTVDILIQTGRYKLEDFLVITDRECGAEKESSKREVAFCRIEDADNESFSIEVQKKFNSFKPELVMLYFSRLITESIYIKQPTFNIHPSLLPSFKGFGAIEQAIDNNSRFLGATLHLAINSADSGHTIAQVITPIRYKSEIEVLRKISFIQKVYLSLCAVEFLENSFIEINQQFNKVSFLKPTRHTNTSNPALNTSQYINAFKVFQNGFGMEVIVP